MINIAIDGFTGSGKGTLAEGLAKKFNLKHLDTGAIFRGIGCAYTEMGYSDLTEEIVNKHIDNISISVVFKDNTQRILLDGKDITGNLRTETASQMASKVSIFGKAREKYLEIVHDFANNYDCIIDGRDITSVVLPNADVKIFLDAAEEIRAKRRFDENVSKNIPCTYEEVLNNLHERDYRDSHREIAPLKIVSDAIVVDNSKLNIDETIEVCSNIVENKLKELGKICRN